MILQSQSGQNQKGRKDKVDIGKSDGDKIKFISYIFGHSGNLANNNDGKDEIENSADKKKVF